MSRSSGAVDFGAQHFSEQKIRKRLEINSGSGVSRDQYFGFGLSRDQYFVSFKIFRENMESFIVGCQGASQLGIPPRV